MVETQGGRGETILLGQQTLPKLSTPNMDQNTVKKISTLMEEQRSLSHAVTCHQAKGGDPTTDNYVVAGGFFDEATAIGFYGNDSGNDASIDLAPTLRSMDKGGENHPSVAFQNTGQGWWNEGDVAGTVRTPEGSDSIQSTVIAFDTTQVTSKTNRSNPQENDPCHTLAKGARPPAIAFRTNQTSAQGPICSEEIADSLAQDHPPAVVYGCYDEQTPKVSEDVMPTLRGRRESGGEMQFVAYEPFGFIHPSQLRNSNSSNQLGIKPDADMSDALTSEGPGAVSFEQRYYADDRMRPGGAPSETVATLKHSSKQGDTSPHVANGMQVRRLTPKECARLQGVSDDHLDILHNGKSLSDINKYKLLGNGFAVPVVAWIGKRIQMVEDIIHGS